MKKWKAPKRVWFYFQGIPAVWDAEPWQDNAFCTKYRSGGAWLKVSHKLLKDRPELFRKPKRPR